MKSTKLSFITAAIAVVATSSAFADNQQHQNQLALQRAQNEQASRTMSVTTVAVYTGDRGVGYGSHSTMYDMRTETRFEMRSNAHGEHFGAFVATK